MATKAECEVEGCSSPVKARGYCTRHYTRFVRHGDPAHVVRQPRAGECEVEGCVSAIHAARLCRLHYGRKARTGDTGPSGRLRPEFKARCTIKGCRRTHVARGWCDRHYESWVKYGDPLEVQRRRLTEPQPCTVEGCKRPQRAKGLRDRSGRVKGLCEMHATRVRTYGSTELPAREKKVTRGSVNSNGYRVVSFDGRVVLEHRLVMEQQIGRPLLPSENVHHKNGVRLDNDPENLELWVKKQCPGARVADLVPWARQLVATYGDLVDQKIIT